MFHDVAAVKKRLDLALGVHKEAYWADLKAFVRGRLPKREWDKRAAKHLGPLNGGLHNEFILAIFESADLAVSLATRNTGSAPKAAKRKPDTTLPGSAASPAVPHKKPKKPSRWLAPFDRDVAPTPLPSESPQAHLEQAVLHANQAVGPPADTTNLARFRPRVYIAAAEAGLSDVSRDATKLIAKGMEVFVKGLLEECIAAKCAYKRAGNVRHSFKARRFPTPAEPSTKNTLTVPDLAHAIALHPHLLGASLSSAREHVTAACWHPMER